VADIDFVKDSCIQSSITATVTDIDFVKDSCIQSSIMATEAS
jgi:hypothetical protein